MKQCKRAVVFFLLFLFAVPVSAGAATEYYKPVEPNRYEERDIKVPVEYIHEKELLKRRVQLPEEQKLLTFAPKEKNDALEHVQLSLFQNSEKPDNNILVKADSLNLFGEQRSLETYVIDPEKQRDNSLGLSVIFGAIVTVISSLLLFVIGPKLNQNI